MWTPEFLLAIGTLVGAVLAAGAAALVRVWDRWSQSAKQRYAVNRQGRRDTIAELYDLIDILRKDLDAVKNECKQDTERLEKEIESQRQKTNNYRFRLFQAERHIEYLQEGLRAANPPIPFKEWKPASPDDSQQGLVSPHGPNHPSDPTNTGEDGKKP